MTIQNIHVFLQDAQKKLLIFKMLGALFVLVGQEKGTSVWVSRATETIPYLPAQ